MVFSSQILGLGSNISRRYGHALLLTALAGLSGCGQKGPLFMAVPPQSAGASASPPAVAAPSLPPLPLLPPLRPASATR